MEFLEFLKWLPWFIYVNAFTLALYLQFTKMYKKKLEELAVDAQENSTQEELSEKSNKVTPSLVLLIITTVINSIFSILSGIWVFKTLFAYYKLL